MGFSRRNARNTNPTAGGKWQTLGKPKIVGTAVVTLKHHAEKGYGLAINDGEGHGWLSLGSELDPASVEEGVLERIERAKKELTRCEELAHIVGELSGMVQAARDAQPKPAPTIDSEALLQAARQALAVKGILPPPTDPRVLAMAQSMAQAAQAAISAGEGAAK